MGKTDLQPHLISDSKYLKLSSTRIESEFYCFGACNISSDFMLYWMYTNNNMQYILIIYSCVSWIFSHSQIILYTYGYLSNSMKYTQQMLSFFEHFLIKILRLFHNEEYLIFVSLNSKLSVDLRKPWLLHMHLFYNVSRSDE